VAPAGPERRAAEQADFEGREGGRRGQLLRGKKEKKKLFLLLFLLTIKACILLYKGFQCV
jgi:hypothetical protein